jgi:hypothetical protein
MKHGSIFAVLVATVLILSACGTQATPTSNPVNVQSTALAVAFTIIAQTQAAVPTITPEPPTAIPTQTALPTETPLPLATSTPASGSTSNSSGGDPCRTRVLSSSPKGESTIIRIANTTKVKVTVSLYLNETIAHGECGWRSYVIDKNSDVVISDLIQACYNLWAWSDDPKLKFNVASDTSCINNPQKWTFLISSSTIKFTF